MFNRSRLENTPQKDEHILRPRDMKVWSAKGILSALVTLGIEIMYERFLEN